MSRLTKINNMNLIEAKRSLKKHGKLDYRGVSFRETVKDGRYTGKYNVIVDGELQNDEPVSLTAAFIIGKWYFI